MSKGSLLIALATILLAAAAGLPSLFNVPGDAMVHLAVAEQFAEGHPFQYNGAGDEVVVASTSPFWTLLLWAAFSATGAMTPLVMKAAVAIAWIGAGILIIRQGMRYGFLSRSTAWLAGAVWFGAPSIAVNSLGGLENVVCAAQLLLLTALLETSRQKGGFGLRMLTGLTFGWILLTRMDAALFGAVILTVYYLHRLLPALFRKQWAEVGRIAIDSTVIIIAAMAINIPWYVYQYRLTGSVVTDSSLARLYGGRRFSLMLIADKLYLHPKAVITLATAFLPLAAGFLVTMWQRAAGLVRKPSGDHAANHAAVCVTLAALVFYTFIVGADHFGRYFLPAFPFFILGGIGGLAGLYRHLPSRAVRILYVAGAAGLLLLPNLYDGYKRYVKHDKFGFNLDSVLSAPGRRAESTDTYLARFGLDTEPDRPWRFAVTEVQLRYFVDERIQVQSLDGRTSARVLDYMNPVNGIPDFEAYITDLQSDIVQLGQWCQWTGYGWVHSIVGPRPLPENLVCTWTKKAAGMTVGDTFTWNDVQVAKAGNHEMRIYWPEVSAPRPNADR